MCLVYFMEAVTGCGGGGCCCLKLRLENQLWKRVFRFQYQRGLGRSLGMSCREKKTDIPTGHLKWLLPPLKSVWGKPQTNHMPFRISWGFSSRCVSCPGELGSTSCAARAPLSPLARVQFAFSDWPPSCFLHNLRASQVGGAPGSGIYTPSKSRKKDQRDPREKRFPSLVLFIIPVLLPLKALPSSTVAPLCILGHSIFSRTCNRALSWEERRLCREREFECVETVSVRVFVERWQCVVGVGLCFPQRLSGKI